MRSVVAVSISVNVIVTSDSGGGLADGAAGGVVSVWTIRACVSICWNSPMKPNSCALSWLRQRYSYEPPIWKSDLQTGMVQPGGPRSHCLTSAGSVTARQSFDRGAWK